MISASDTQFQPVRPFIFLRPTNPYPSDTNTAFLPRERQQHTHANPHGWREAQ